MQAQANHPFPLSLLDVVAQWWKRRERRNYYGIEALPDADVARIAKDIGVSPVELRALDRRSDHDLPLPRMMAALRLDRFTLMRTAPDTVRDMERVCALCDCKRRCERDLADGDAAINFEAYCPNAPTLRTLC